MRGLSLNDIIRLLALILLPSRNVAHLQMTSCGQFIRDPFTQGMIATAAILYMVFVEIFKENVVRFYCHKCKRFSSTCKSETTEEIITKQLFSLLGKITVIANFGNVLNLGNLMLVVVPRPVFQCRVFLSTDLSSH